MKPKKNTDRPKKQGCKTPATLLSDEEVSVYGDLLFEVLLQDGINQLFKGFEDGKTAPEMLSDESIAEKLPSQAAPLRMLDHGHGHGFRGRLAEFAIYQVREQAGLEPVEFEGAPPLEETGEPTHPLYADGICGGLLLRQLQDALESGDGAFFRTLAEMIEKDYLEPPNQLDAVGYALQAKLDLEKEGKPVTKKTVREKAERKRAEFLVRRSGKTPTPDLIAREIEGANWNWNWKRIWKQHPDIEGLDQDPGGRPATRRKPGTK
jgi:hypothetical protein